jgi:REP element-mobilizing transposase RayT
MRFLPEEFYHIYNRGINSQKIFFEERNYDFFLSKVIDYIFPLCDVVSFCLMPTHYHLLIRTMGENTNDSSAILSRKIGTLQSSYTQAINKQENRTGSLFQQRAKAKRLDIKDTPFICFHYIHQNPVKGELCERMED